MYTKVQSYEINLFLNSHITLFLKTSCNSITRKIILQHQVGKKVSSDDRRQHHHYVVLVARISLTLFRHFSLLFIAYGRSSGLHPLSSHSCYMYVRAACPAFARPYVGVHRSTSLMSSSLLLQQCPACLVRLT